MRRLTILINKATGYVDIKWWSAGDLGRFLSALTDLEKVRFHIQVSRTQVLED